MKRPTFFHGVIVAAVFAFFTSATIATLTPFVGFMSVIRFVIPALGLAYVLYLFSRSKERVGRVTTLCLWSALAAVTWWVAPPLPLYLLIHVGAMWLVRSLYQPYRQRVLSYLVFFPGAGVVRGDSSGGQAQGKCNEKLCCRKRTLRACTAPGRPGAHPIV
jgi:hypothetical protein